MVETARHSAALKREPAADPPDAGAETPPAARPSPPTDVGRPASLDDQKRDFLRLVSHELRTPVNSILGFSEILSAEILGPLGAPQYKEYAEIIRGSGKRLLKLVNQVLEIGRLQGLKLEVGPEVVEPALEAAVAALADDFAARRIRWRILAEAGGVQALADAWGLRTVLTHLVQNAVAASPEGGEVRLVARRAGGFIDIFVEDDGEGVDLAELPRLMRPFEQGEAALHRRGEGAGLGLTIAELTCQAMDARLSLRNRPAGGLSTRVRLQAA